MSTEIRARILGLAFVVFALAGFLSPAAASSVGNPPAATNNPYQCEGEFYTSKTNGKYSTIAYDYKPNASKKNTVHIGSNSSNPYYGVGDMVLYTINFARSYNAAVLQVRYADGVAGNIIAVYLDYKLCGTFTTANTGGWNSFVWHPTIIPLGVINPGTHVVSFLVSKGGSYGMNLDVFKITGQ